MSASTTIADRALHLVIFLCAGVALGIFALGLLERLTGATRRIIGTRHVLISAAALGVSFLAERIYHAVS